MSEIFFFERNENEKKKCGSRFYCKNAEDVSLFCVGESLKDFNAYEKFISFHFIIIIIQHPTRNGKESKF